jgi:hypothetical protein
MTVGGGRLRSGGIKDLLPQQTDLENYDASYLGQLQFPLWRQMIDIHRLSAHATAGLHFSPRARLQEWESRVKRLSKSEITDDVVPENGLTRDLDDFNVDFADGALVPTLDIPDTLPNLEDQRARLGDNPSASLLTSLVKETIPLNRKQTLIVEHVLAEALAWKEHPYDASKREQLCLLTLGEAGVGKSWDHGWHGLTQS